jgi:hypothetical protein
MSDSDRSRRFAQAAERSAGRLSALRLPAAAVASSVLFLFLSYVTSRYSGGRTVHRYELTPALGAGLSVAALFVVVAALWIAWRARTRPFVSFWVVAVVGFALYEFWYVQI